MRGARHPPRLTPALHGQNLPMDVANRWWAAALTVACPGAVALAGCADQDADAVPLPGIRRCRDLRCTGRCRSTRWSQAWTGWGDPRGRRSAGRRGLQGGSAAPGGWGLPGDCTVRGFPAPNVHFDAPLTEEEREAGRRPTVGRVARLADELAAAAWVGEGPNPHTRTAP